MDERNPFASLKKVCCYCNNACSGAHQCRKCSKPCHAIAPCSFSTDDDEGFGAKVTCCNCWLSDDDDDVASKGWLECFMQRHNFSLRRPTTVAQKEPESYTDSVINFILYVQRLMHKNEFGMDSVGLGVNSQTTDRRLFSHLWHHAGN
ncbi:hypothetical protein niasHT_027536 [Heterodera trifolii]|uniref:SCAN domain-containing protein n=1 Tax=Heterodera trifolii TaxID=157864 RepID=A0ABD2K537_9BILA